ncbi:MAG: WD40 repeat domain-containing protein [Anaerolineales bacterium]|nr:WD40 repeat domain-containing protein [Anaerolineales bacterium]
MSRALSAVALATAAAVWLAACGNAPAASIPAAASEPAATLASAATPTAQPTQPSPTPTAVLPSQPLTVDTVSQVVAFERLGKGAVLNLWPVPAAETVLVHTTRTLSLFADPDMQLIAEIPLPPGFALSPQQDLLAEVDAEGNFNLRSLKDLSLVRSLGAIERREYVRLHFSPDGSLLALSNFGTLRDVRIEDHHLHVYDTESGDLVSTLDWGEYAPLPAFVHFSPDHKYVLTEGSGLMAIWDFETGRLLHRVQPRSFFPDQPFHAETNYFISERDSIIYVWDPVQGKPIREYGTDLAGVRSIDWSEDYEYLSFNQGEQVRTYFDGYEATRFQAARYLYPPVYLVSALHAPEFAGHLAQLSAQGYLAIPEAGWLQAGYPGQAWLRFSDGNGAILPGPAGEVLHLAQWQPAQSRVNVFNPPIGEVLQLDVQRDLALTCLNSRVVVYSLSTGSSAALGRCTADSAMAISQDGSTLAVGIQVIELYDTASGALLGSLRAHEYPLVDIVFTDNDHKLLSFAQAYTLAPEGDNVPGGKYWAGVEMFVWSLEEPVRRLTSLTGAAAEITNIILSPDGQHLAAAEGERVRIWQLANGQQLTGFSNPVVISSLAWSPAGDMLVLGGDEGSLHFWDWQARSLLHSERIHSLPLFEVLLPGKTLSRYIVWPRRTTFPVLDLRFSEEGAGLYSLSADGQLILWAIP